MKEEDIRKKRYLELYDILRSPIEKKRIIAANELRRRNERLKRIITVISVVIAAISALVAVYELVLKTQSQPIIIFLISPIVKIGSSTTI